MDTSPAFISGAFRIVGSFVFL